MGAYERQVEGPADLDLDGFVGAGDLVVLLGAWGTAGPGADLAHPIDVVDAGDLVALVAVWGGCE